MYTVYGTCTCRCSNKSHMLVICIFVALVQEPTKMIIVEQKAPTEATASMQKNVTASSVHMEGASVQAGSFSSFRSATTDFSFESMSASGMTALMTESVVSTSSTSQVMEMSTHAHVEALSSLGALTAGHKRGEVHFTSCLNLSVI